MLRFPLLGKKLPFHWILLILLAAFLILLRTLVDVGGGDQDLTPATVVRVIDGDTVDVEIEGQVVRVRYYGSDAPEAGEPCADEATSRNRQLVESQSVLLQTSDRDKDPGGRLLRYVFTTNGRLVDDVLISEGLARAWRRDGTYRDQLLDREEAAVNDAVGCLWR
ncbi:MAG: thermonuclease family protein [Dehalococcoidia bacterium]